MFWKKVLLNKPRLTIFLAALILRIAAALLVGPADGGEAPHISAAKGILAGQELIFEDGLRSWLAPVLVYVFAASFWLFGETLLPLQWSFIVLSALSCVLLYSIGKELFGSERGAQWAGWLLAFYPAHIFWSTRVAASTLATVFFVIALWLMSCYQKNRKSIFLALSGLCWALLSLTRGEYFLGVGAVLIYLFILNKKALKPRFRSWARWNETQEIANSSTQNLESIPAAVWSRNFAQKCSDILRRIQRSNCGTWVKPMVIFFAFLALGFSPWVIRNWKIHHRFILLTTNSADNFLFAFNPRYHFTGHAIYPPGALDAIRGKTEVERSKILMGYALDFIRENPGRALYHWAGNLAHFWRPWLSVDAVSLSQNFVYTAGWLPVFILCLWGLKSIPWESRPYWIFLGLIVMFKWGGHSFFYVIVRFREAIVPALILFACHSALLIRKIGDKEYANRL